MKPQDCLISYIQQSIRNNWEVMALTDFNGASFLYRDVARKIAKLHLLFENAGLKPGDRIALCGRNSANWAVAALASLTYGTVTVPILHDFKPENVHHLVCHSEARLLFVDSGTWENLDHANMPNLQGAILLNDYSLLFSRNKRLTAARKNLNKLFGDKYPERFSPEDVTYKPQDKDTVAVINYTSGSMGFSKTYRGRSAHHREDSQDQSIPRARKADDESDDATARCRPPYPRKNQTKPYHRLRRPAERADHRRSRSQQGRRGIPEKDSVPLHRGLRND